MMFGLALIFAVLVVLILLTCLVWLAGSYNGLLTAQTQIETAFSQIEMEYQSRHSLIPNIVETARGFMRHERETLEAVVVARNQAVVALQLLFANPADPENIQKLLKAEEGLGNVMGRLMTISEVYPELKANQNMIQLTGELASNARDVSAARENYNQSVTSYNRAVKSFPTVLIVGFLGFQQANLFEFKEAAEKEPQIVHLA
jgi:LemA protein